MNQQIYSFTHDQLLNYLDNLTTQEREGNQKEALRTLVDFVLLKRNQWTGGLQKLMYRYFDMSFEQNQHQNLTKMLKEYRSVTQNLYSESLNDVLAYFRDKKISKILDDIVAKYDIEALKNLDNIEEEEPLGGDLLFDSFNIAERRGDNELKANMRIVWNGYKSIIETVKSNSKLEDLYLSTLRKLFEFALKYNRKQEFKEFCKTLGYGLHNVLGKKYVQTEAMKANYTDYENAEVNEKNVQIRFEQFQVALKLGLWQSSFEIIEDINELLIIRKGTIKKQTYYKYYLNLSKLFKKSGYWNYYAYTYFSYYNIFSRNPKIDQKELQEITDHLLLSILSIPSFPIENLQTQESQKKILNLLSMTNKIPGKEELYKIVGEKGIIELASEEVKDLWEFIFVEFNLLHVSQKLPLLNRVKESPNEDNRNFGISIEKNIISQQITQLSKIYTKIKFSNICKIVPFNQQVVLSTLLLAQQNGTLHFKYDEGKSIVEFKQKSEEKTAYSELNRVSKEIALIAEKLSTGETTFVLKKVEDLLANGKELYEIRKNKINEFIENLKKPRKEAREEAAKEIERERLAKEAEKNERKAKEIETKEKEALRQKELGQKKALIREIIKIKDRRVIRIQGKTIENLDDKDLDKYTVEQIEQLKKETEKKNKQDTQNKYKKAFVKTDYIERERRDRIIPIIKKGWAANENQTAEIMEKSKQNFEIRQNKKEYLSKIEKNIRDEMAQGREIVTNQFEIDSKAYKERVTKDYKERILLRAQQLRKEAEEEKKRLEEDRKRRELERAAQQAEDLSNPFIIRRSNIPSGGAGSLGATTTQPATTAGTGNIGWRNTGATTTTAPTQPIATTATTGNTGWRNTGGPSTTSTVSQPFQPVTTATIPETSNDGWRNTRTQPPKQQPPKPPTTTQPANDGSWRKKQ